MDNNPNPRVKAALEELSAALHEQFDNEVSSDDVAGFSAGLTIGAGRAPGGSAPTRLPVPIGTAFCLFRGTDSCGFYSDEGDGAPGSCTVYIWGN